MRQRWARSLVEEYRYLLTDIGIEVSIALGSTRRRADIVIYRRGSDHIQENIVAIVELKRDDVGPNDAKNGVEQLISYMAACPSCQHGLWVGSERHALSRNPQTGEVLRGIADIPRGNEKPSHSLRFTDLTPSLDLTSVFQRCHNYIYANEGIHYEDAFYQMQKLIFCKVLDETESDGPLSFYVTNDERLTDSGGRRLLEDRIQPLFEAVKRRYDFIFNADEEIGLTNRVLAYVVSEMQRTSLLDTKTDIKGAAYEAMVSTNLRGNRGEYFTPRNVCDVAVEIVLATYEPSQLTSLKVVDPCCGTGGFLVAYVNQLREILDMREESKRGQRPSAADAVASQLKEVCTRNLYGLDINPNLVRTCQMNLVMHGDGSANVFQANTLLTPGEWGIKGGNDDVPHGMADVVYTNPPFGSEALVDDPHVLANYELSTFGAESPRTTMPAEQLFVESALRFVKPRGRLAIVLPDSILNNPSLKFMRQWLLTKTRIFASVDLPKETFATSGGVPNPSLLVLEKLNNEEQLLASTGALGSYKIFMSTPRSAGVNQRGKPAYRRSPDGFHLLTQSGEPMLDDEVRMVGKAFRSWQSSA